MNAVYALGAGLLAVALVALYLGTRWLRLQEREAGTDEPPALGDAAAFASNVRALPAAMVEADREAWAREQRAAGKTPEQVRRELEDREPVLYI